MLNADIHDDSIGKVREATPISAPEIGQEESPKVDSGASSIEKSKAVHPEVIPPMNIPILTAPSSDQQCMAFTVASIDATGRPVTNTIHSFVLKGEEIKNSILEGWMKNLREIEEYVRQLLASPVYQQLQEIRRKGDPQSDSVSGIQGVTSANAATRSGEQVELLSTLDRLQVLERVPPSAEVVDTSAPQDSSRVLVLPLTAALLAGGGLAVGMELAHGTNPLGGVMELVERLQPLFPTISVQDLVPLINLMIVGPIYFNSWNEAISNLRSRERHSHVPVIQNFAKDVIKIVTDPNFVNATLIQRMEGTEHLSPQDQDRLARMLKVVLIGVALSLLYSAEVGKVQNGQFGGIEPEELRELLLGKFTELPDPNKKVSTQEQLAASLINRAWEQLEPLSTEDRAAAVELLLSYVTQSRDLDPMLDPAKVFDEAIAASTFDPKGKVGMVKA
jgi:hypothetical protein